MRRSAPRDYVQNSATERRRPKGRRSSPNGASVVGRPPGGGAPNDRSGAASLYWRTGVVRTLRRELAGSPVARRPPVGSEAGAHGHNRAQKSRLARSPWSPERSVQTLCRSARPASTSGFTGASSRLEPRPSPSDGDALPWSTARRKCPLSRAFERTTGLEPATLTLAR